MRGNEADQDTTPLVTEPQYQPSFSLDVDQSSIAYTVATPTPTQTHISFENLADITDLEPTELLMGDNIKAEVSVLLMSSIPIVLSTMSQLLLMFPLMAAIGRLGTLALASMNLVAIYAGLFGVAPMSGMAMALDSLCSQAYTAARDRRLLGVYLQRVLVALLMIQLTLYPLWWNSQGIYEWLGVPHEVAKMTGSMLRLYFFGIALMIIFECQKSFLFAQGIRRFVVVAQVVCLPIGWLSIWLFVANPSTSFGFLGAPWVIILVGVGFNLVTLLFIVKVDGYQCWGGWSGLAFTGLRPVFKLGLAGSAIAFFESVAQHMIDLGVLFLDAPSMAAQAILSMMLNGISMAGTGFAIAACNRIGNLLGSGHPNRAILSVYTTAGITAAIFTFACWITVTYRKQIPSVFTTDQEVADILTSHIPWAAGAGAVQGINMAFNGVLRGQGRQALIARIRMLAFLGVGIPISALSAVVFKWGLAGLWFGYIVSLVTILLAQIYEVSVTDWAKEIERCQRRVSDAILATDSENSFDIERRNR